MIPVSKKGRISENVVRVVQSHFSDRKVEKVIDKGNRIKQIYEVAFDSGEPVIVKVQSDPELGDIHYEVMVCEFLREHGLPAPRVLVKDYSRQELPYPYLIEERLGGTQLGRLLPVVNETDTLVIYETLGRFYRRMHRIEHEQSGLWGDHPRQLKYPIAPNDYMYRAEIVEGSGKLALEQGFISRNTYERAVLLWAKHLEQMKQHQPCLVHVSPFLWTIYLERCDAGWQVVKLTSLGDVMWWDRDYDLATLLYPPFGQMNDLRREAFLRGYGAEPVEKRLLLYAVMHRLCAAMGVYMEPEAYRNQEWVRKAFGDVDRFLTRIEECSSVKGG